MTYNRINPRLDIATCTSLPITFVFLPASDIPTYVGSGDVDVGITGQDVIEEDEVEVNQILKLGFGKCRLCVQVPADSGLNLNDLLGRRVVTSFENVTKKYFRNLSSDIFTPVRYVSGSVEAACALGLADGIGECDGGNVLTHSGLGGKWRYHAGGQSY